MTKAGIKPSKRVNRLKISATHFLSNKEVARITSEYKVRDPESVVVSVGSQLLASLVPSEWEGHYFLRSGDYASFVAICKRDLNDLLTTDHDLSIADFRDAYQAVNLLRKYPFDLGIDREEVAFQKWTDAEEQCRLTNQIFQLISEDGCGGIEDSVFSALHPSVYPVLRRAKRKISLWLGRFDPREWIQSCRFGDGASTSCRGAELSVGDKLASTLEYQGNGNILGALLRCFPRWQESHPSRGAVYCPGSLVTTVPKDALQDRVINIEPTLSGFAQLGLGNMLRVRLRRVGCNLNDQTINQRLALRAVASALSTVDLSSASDTVSRALVRWLMPPDWLFALESCRSSVSLLKGRRVELEKFSSMGNGYTFELESLVFLALLRASADEAGVRLRMQENCHVYGDDIICPTAVFPVLFQALHFCGFTLNSRKTFVGGPFRESCGCDVYKGVPVTPLYIKDRTEDALDVVLLANRVYHYAAGDVGVDSAGCDGSRTPADDVLTFADRRWLPAFKGVVSSLPPSLRKVLVGPWTPGVNSPWIPSSFDAASPARERVNKKPASGTAKRHGDYVTSNEGHEVRFQHYMVNRVAADRYSLDRWTNALDIALYLVRDNTTGLGVLPDSPRFKLDRTWKSVVSLGFRVVDSSILDGLPRGRRTSTTARRKASRWVDPPAWI